jgi:transcriptional regulator with PAS, ATPase and Fis domain
MHILSDQQFQQITTALEHAFVAINACQHVELDMTQPAIAPVAKAVKVTPVQKPKSQTKTRVSRRRTRGALNERQVLEIKRQLQAGGKSVAKIAKEFGVHSTTINCIKWGKTWKHVTLQQAAPVIVHA